VGNTRVMADRLEQLTRFIVIGYPLGFIFLWAWRFWDYVPPSEVRDLTKMLYFDETTWLFSEGDFPLYSIITTILLFGIRWLVYGKTYQK